MIKCENLTIKYGGFTAVENISFSVSEGDWLCIMGENGAGKSSVIKALLGLCKSSEGQIVKSFSCGLGYVPQILPIQGDFPASGYEIALSGFVKKAGLFYRAEQKREALEKMRMLEIEDIKNVCFCEMSGGQKQRVLLARALCAGEKILVLDEPMSGLDEDACKKFYSVLYELNQKGTTIIMISHDSENSLKYANKILHLKKFGYFFGNKEEFLGEQRNDF